MKPIVRAALLAASVLPVGAFAQSKDAARFGAREYVQQISLSPDGTHVAMIEPLPGRGAALVIADLATGETKTVVRSSGDPDRLTDCHWASTTRVICNVFMIRQLDQKLAFTRMVSLNSDGSDLKVLSSRESSSALGIMQSGGDVIDWGPDGSNGSVLMSREFVPEYSTGTHIASQKEGMGVELVDAATLRRKQIEQPNPKAAEYISDGHGTVRIMGVEEIDSAGNQSGRISYSYRLAGERGWKKLGDLYQTAAGSRGFNPYAVDRDANVVYGFESLDGRGALYSVSLDGSLTRKLVASNPQVDIDGLIRIGRQRRVVGVSYVTDKRSVDFFDPELRKLRDALGKALPGKPLVTFVDASADEKKLLLFAGSDNDAGTYYLYDKTTRQLAEVMPSRPQLSDVKLAMVKPVSFPPPTARRSPAI